MEQKQITTNSPEETELIASKIGSQLRGGEVIELVSDLGGGKTTFVRGLANGLGSIDRISSPTFTISNQYKSKRNNLTLYHYDFYRLSDPGILSQELAESMNDAQAVTIIEWGEIVERILPDKRITITIKPTNINMRALSLSYPKSLQYAMKEL